MKLNLIKNFLLIVLLVVFYFYSPYKLTFLGYYNSKIGAHKCNTISKSQSAGIFFNIIELDLHFTDNKTFDIFHPDDNSTNLSLDKYLSKINSLQDIHLWLDIKNLKENNAQEVLHKLSILVNKYGLQNKQLLIETRYPRALKTFTKNNFECSYYITDKLWKLSESKIKDHLNKISAILNEQPDIAISFDHQNYSILKNTFPLRNIYTWNISRLPIKDVINTRKILNDDKVQIMLIKYNSLNF